MNLILDTLYFNTLRDPWFLVLLAFVPLLLLIEWSARAPGILRISTGETLARLRQGGSGIARRTPALLRAIGLCLLILALARPLHGYQLRTDRTDVIDIMLCVDVSGSMRQMDFRIGGVYRDRLFVVKQTVLDFLETRVARRGSRFGAERIGLILYAGIAWTQVPLTLDYDILRREIERAHIDDTDPAKQGTAIGSAIGLATWRLKDSEAESKVMILLTDGLNNRGELDPITAAHVANEYGIRIYTIGAGSPQGGMISQGGLLLNVSAAGIDEESMTKVAEITGGRYFRATDTESLAQAYEEISALERTEIEAGEYYEYDEAFVPYALLGGLLTLAGIFARRRWFEPIP